MDDIKTNHIELLKQTISHLVELSKRTEDLLRQKNPNGLTDINAVKKFYDLTNNFSQYCNKLNEEEFSNNIANIYKTTGGILGQFSSNIFKIMEKNQLDELKSFVIQLPQEFLNTMASLANYLKNANNELINQKDNLVNKLDEYKKFNVNQQESYIPMNNLNEDGFLYGISQGILGFIGNSLKLITDKNFTLDSSLTRISNVFSRISNTTSKLDLSNSWKEIGSFFTSSQMGVLVGGLIAAAGSYVLIKKLFTNVFICILWFKKEPAFYCIIMGIANADLPL